MFKINTDKFGFAREPQPDRVSRDYAAELVRKLMADEKAAREARDDVLESYISEEAETRGAKDAMLQSLIGDINAVLNSHGGSISGLLEQVQAEAQARGNKDDALQALINALQAAVDKEIGDRTSKDTELDTRITAEASAREAKDTELQDKITAEASAREAADTTLDGKITAEASAREAADERLKYYGDKDIIPSPDEYFIISNNVLTGLTDEGKQQAEIVIPYNVTRIDHGAFEGCANLINLIIPKSVTALGEYVFASCSKLKKIIIPNSITYINFGDFSGCTNLTSITLHDSITNIGNEVFNGCTALKSIILPNSITSIGVQAFNGCISLTSINIPNSVTSIGYSAFNGCTALTKVVIPNSVISIGDYAFTGCTNLTIYCEQGSYADTYAKENNIPVVYTDVKAEMLDKKQDKVTISEYPEDNSELIYDLSIMHNQELRTKSTLANGITFLIPNDVYPDDYVTSLSFNTGDTAPQVSYSATGIIQWIGTDCSIVDGKSIFAPKPNIHYDIVIYFNGFQFVGLVNGFVTATIPNSGIVSEATEVTS